MNDLMNYIVRRSEIIAEVKAAHGFDQECSLREAINNTTDWRERLNLFRMQYECCNKMHAEGLFDWMCADPYFLCDFQKVLSPIEMQMWEEVRANGLALWPQYPVGRFMVDFGNPVLKVAVECDGAAYHDPQKDAERDRELEKLGWKVLRVSGRACNRILPTPDRHEFESEDDYRIAYRKWEFSTLGGVVNEVRALVLDYRARHLPSGEDA